MEVSGQERTEMDIEKQTLVRVKRKRNDDPVETLWLEVTQRPIKRQEAAFPKLSINGTTDEPAGDKESSSRSLYQRVETLTSSGVRDLDIPGFLRRVKETKETQEKRQHATNTKDKDKQRPATATAPREESSAMASFKQVPQSRKPSKSSEIDPMQEFFRLYDVVRIDGGDDAAKAGRRSQAKREVEAELRQGQLMYNYLPMLRELVPSAVTEIEADAGASARLPTSLDDYVYDVYVLNEGSVDSEMGEASGPLVKIMEHEYWDEGEAVVSDVDSDDSNCEDNPQNDYPDEEDDSSREISPYGSDNEEYDTVLSVSDDEEDFRKWR